MARKTLRAVGENEVLPEPVVPPTLAEAVESGNVLDMLLAQRRLIADGLASAADNTRPQLNNELNKLHALIREEQARVEAAAKEEAERVEAVADEAFDASAV